jgi:hypothetical protein
MLGSVMNGTDIGWWAVSGLGTSGIKPADLATSVLVNHK